MTTPYIGPGSPWQESLAESFNCRFRDEFLNTELLAAVPEAQALADRWSWEYNTLKPHLALQGRTPLETAQAAAAEAPTLIAPGPMKGVTSLLQSAQS